MVKEFDEVNVLKQKEILNSLLDSDLEVTSDYEAQRIIMSKIMEAKQENNLDNFSITSYIKNTTITKWKCNPRKKNDSFLKVFYEEIRYARETHGLDDLEVSFLFSISEYLAWETNLLIDNEGNPMNQKMLCDITGYNRKKVYRYTKSLEDKKCLIRVWDGRDVYYIINPNLIFKGQNIDRGIPKLFTLIGYVESECV